MKAEVPQHVLVVDDDVSARLLARAVLEEAGLLVSEASTGMEALTLSDQERFDLVLLDVGLPDADGFTVVERLRARPVGGDVPVIMLTGRDDIESVTHAYAAGATDFASKPVNWLVLAQRVLYVLRSCEDQRRLEISQSRLNEAQQIAQLGDWEVDLTTGALMVSAQVRRIFGVPEGEADGPDALLERVHPNDRERLLDGIRELVETGRELNLQHSIVGEGEEERCVHTHASLVVDERTGARRLRGFCQDITRRRSAEQQLEFVRLHDTLTGLLNQRAFREVLDVVLAQRHRTEESHCLLLVNLDRFKRINDSLGREAGDHVLRAVSQRLADSIRSTDVVSRGLQTGDPATISRVGGDEFSILIGDIDDVRDIAQVAERILEGLRAPLVIDEGPVVLTASIGIALAPDDGEATSPLVSNAEAAMRDAKQRGGDGYQFYRSSMNAATLDRLRLEADLRTALEVGDIHVHYQPRIGMESGVVMSAEALARWRHPERGDVSPVVFVPLSEDSGQIYSLGEAIVNEVCRQLHAWREFGYAGLPISINVSGTLLSDPRLPRLLEDATAKYGVELSQLEIEITEGALIRCEEEAGRALRTLKDLGLRIALDDFGTGYSALAYLQRFPVDIVKIDRSFVAAIGEEPESHAIVRGILSMAKAMGLCVVAEGVETMAQREFLREHGCDQEQGFLYSKPLPPHEFERLFWPDGIPLDSMTLTEIE